MTCINDYIIQSYIDKELTDAERQNVDEHLATCEKCRVRVEELEKRSLLLKGALQSTASPVEMREFIKPEPVVIVKKKYRRLIYASSAVAASFLLMLCLTHEKTNAVAPEVSYLVYDIESDFNANLPLSEQDFVVHIIDSEGNQTEL